MPGPRAFFGALERRDQAAIGLQAWIFAGLALLTMALAVAQLGARQMLALSWRRWLVHHLQDRWAREARNYHMGLLPDAADNPDQRISENTRWATAMAVELAVGLLVTAVLMLVSFVGILWIAVGRCMSPSARTEFDIPGYMVWARPALRRRRHAA